MELEQIARRAQEQGIAPIHIPEIMEALGIDPLGTLIMIVRIWGIKADKYAKREQDPEYAKRYPKGYQPHKAMLRNN